MIKSLIGGALAATALMLLSSTAIAEPEVVSGPAAEADCFAPWAADTKFFKFPKKEGPYRDRARQRLHRQHLAHPDDPDRQGLCGTA